MRPADTVRGRHLLRGGPRAVTALVALVGVVVLIAGCGGGSSLSVASIAGSKPSGARSHSSSSRSNGGGAVRFLGAAPSPAQRVQQEVVGLLFSRCMRSHGVPNYPDPPAPSGGGVGLFVFGGSGIDPAAPLFRIAQRSCFSILTHRRGGLG